MKPSKPGVGKPGVGKPGVGYGGDGEGKGVKRTMAMVDRESEHGEEELELLA